MADLICLLFCQSSDTVSSRNTSAKFQEKLAKLVNGKLIKGLTKKIAWEEVTVWKKGNMPTE